MTTPELDVLGLLYVNSKITRPEVLSEETFIEWYSKEHIPEILNTSGVNSALRFKNVDPKAERPYLVLYPMNNIGFTQSDEFKKINIYSDILPDGAPVYDLTDMDIRLYSFIDKYEPNGPTESGMLEARIRWETC
jgi:hypothetical protein